MSVSDGVRSSRLSQIVAVTCTAALSVVVAYTGAGYEPGASAYPLSAWDFRVAATPLWYSPNAQVLRAPEGLAVMPHGEPSSVSSGLVALDARSYSAVRLRVTAQKPSEGWLWLVLRTSTGTTRAPRAFHVQGGGAPEDIMVPLALDAADSAVIREVVLVPSAVPQPVTVSSIAFEPREGSVSDAIRELWSPSPGQIAATAPFAMHTLSPPLVGGRSVWTVLIPAVLLAGTVAMLAGDRTSAYQAAIRHGAWGIVCAVWIVGFGLAVYHQAVALSVDLSRFGGLPRAEAYAVIDYVPLWEDMREAARSVPPHTSVEVLIDWDRSDVVTTWNARAAYYLYPIVVRSSSPVRIRYFGRAHVPCAKVEPNRPLLHEAERFCVFGVTG